MDNGGQLEDATVEIGKALAGLMCDEVFLADMSQANTEADLLRLYDQRMHNLCMRRGNDSP